MMGSESKGYVLREAEGRSYRWSELGYLFTIKAMGNEMADNITFIEFATEKGSEPSTHTHQDEDEIFYVLSGELTVKCGEDSLHAGPKDFVFLPANVPHSYTIKSDGLIHLLVIAITRKEGGRDFAREIEQFGEPVDSETVLRYMEELRTR
jgi:quercetin dioxygenase-like cupin family protein